MTNFIVTFKHTHEPIEGATQHNSLTRFLNDFLFPLFGGEENLESIQWNIDEEDELYDVDLYDIESL
jgi:hypothetical protein